MASKRENANQSLRLFGFTFAVTSAYILCRTVSDAVLLSRLGAAALPAMVILGAIAVGSVSYLWESRTRQMRLSRLVVFTQVGILLCTAILLVLLGLHAQSTLVIGGLYLIAEIRGCFSTIMIVVILNEGTTRNSDKSRFALVNAGAPLGGIVIGGLIGAGASEYSATTLLCFCCGFDIAALLAFYSRRSPHAPKYANQVSPLVVPSNVPDPTRILAPAIKHHLDLKSINLAKLIMLLVVCKIVVLTIVGYEWKVFASRQFPQDEQGLKEFFGYFYAMSDGLILMTHLLATRYFLGPRGMKFCLILLPIYLAVFGIASLMTSSGIILFWLLTVARGSMVVRRGLHDVALQVLYGWLPEESRRETVAKIFGSAKPLAEAAAATTILVLSPFIPTQGFGWLWIPFVLIWLYTIHWLLKYWALQRRDDESGPESQHAES